jgi:hypothetical protein
VKKKAQDPPKIQARVKSPVARGQEVRTFRGSMVPAKVCFLVGHLMARDPHIIPHSLNFPLFSKTHVDEILGVSKIVSFHVVLASDPSSIPRRKLFTEIAGLLESFLHCSAQFRFCYQWKPNKSRLEGLLVSLVR